jgi:hypothetical protein
MLENDTFLLESAWRSGGTAKSFLYKYTLLMYIYTEQGFHLFPLHLHLETGEPKNR